MTAQNAHEDFQSVTVIRGRVGKPWGCFRKPLEGRVQDNLRKWKTGGLKRLSGDAPFRDLIVCPPARGLEARIAPHPSLKPQKLMRQIVRASLPMGHGTILDPFMGSGATVAAANACGLDSIGIEIDDEYFRLAQAVVPLLAEYVPSGDNDHG